jgi:hypothetical protein
MAGRKEKAMNNISGSVSVNVRAETLLSLEDRPNHQLLLSELQGMQKSPDPGWNNARLTYWGSADLLSGSGTQRGYYVNEHEDGDRDMGTFEGKVTLAGDEATLEGTFSFTEGTGKLKGIRGGGSYKGRMVSPTEVQMTWSGSYEVAAGTGRAA